MTLRSGYTLLEVLLVMALLVALAGMAAPALFGPLENQRLRRSADIIRAEWTKARVWAMESGQTYVFRYQPSGNQYVVQPLNSQENYVESSLTTLSNTASLPAGAANNVPGNTVANMPGIMAADGSTTGVQAKVLPENVGFAASETTTDMRGELLAAEDMSGVATDPQWSSPIFFYPDGTTSTARLVLGNQRQRYVVLTMRGLTGVIHVSGLLTSEELQ